MFKVLFNIFGERKPKASEPKRASITSYPDRINIDTYHKIGKEKWDWRSAAIVTKLSFNTTNEQIGKTVKMHIELTRYNVKDKRPKVGVISEYWRNYLSAHGFETETQLQKDALRVEIYETNGIIMLVPTYNGGSSGRDRGFYARDWDAIKCKLTDSDENLGNKIMKALARCSD